MLHFKPQRPAKENLTLTKCFMLKENISKSLNMFNIISYHHLRAMKFANQTKKNQYIDNVHHLIIKY